MSDATRRRRGARAALRAAPPWTIALRVKRGRCGARRPHVAAPLRLVPSPFSRVPPGSGRCAAGQMRRLLASGTGLGAAWKATRICGAWLPREWYTDGSDGGCLPASTHEEKNPGLSKHKAPGSQISVAARRRRAGSPAMPSLEDDEDAKAVKQDDGDIPPIVQKVCVFICRQPS